MTVTLPPGVVSGQTIHVQAPDGRLNAIIVPPGFGPGSTFTVEFAPDPPATFTASDPIKKYDNSYPVAQATTSTDYNANNNTSNNNQDDGFATGFGNSHWQPATAAANPYSANTNTNNYYNNDNRNNNNNNTADDDFATGFGNNSYSAYPTATAKPVYSTTPAYPY